MTQRRVLGWLTARRSAATLAALTAVAGVALSGCGSGDGGEQGGQGGTQFVAGTGEITKVPRGERATVPDISGETVDGERLDLADYRGKVVVLNVWGSWCAPCRAEAPNLAAVAKEMKGEGVQFVGINTRDLDKANARAFDRRYGIEYPSLYDPSGKLILRFPKNSLSPQAIPSTVVIDREGRIAVRALKALSKKDLRAVIQPVLEESGKSGGK